MHKEEVEIVENKDAQSTPSLGQPNYCNITPSISSAKDNGDGTCDTQTTEMIAHQRYCTPPSEVQSTAGNEVQHTQTTSSPSGESDSASSDNAQSPTLDEFLARILQRRRESKDINQACDNGKTDILSSTKLTLGRTGKEDPRRMMQIMGVVGTTNTAPTPHYYNLPPLLRSNAVSEDYDWSEEDERENEEKKFEESYGEKEFRSAWLRRRSGVQKDLIQNQDKDTESSHDVSTPTYLKILPLTIDSSHPQTLPTSQASHMNTHTVSSSDSTTEQGMSIPEENEPSSTPESGSPLWDTPRPWTRLARVVSPLTLDGRENAPDSPTLPNPPSIPQSSRRYTRRIQRTMHGFNSSYEKHSEDVIVPAVTSSNGEKVFQKLVAVAGDGRRASNAKMTRAIRRRPLGILGPLPSLPQQSMSDSEHEVESDYEWAEIGEALSDTGSDIYTQPDLPSLNVDVKSRRSASCSELVTWLPPSPNDIDSSFLYLSHRPPAPLPTPSQGTIALAHCALCLYK